jgi:pyridoxal phosphate enzyme (YggS family)
VNDVAANLARIRETIASAALSVGRAPGDIKLVAVSKGHPVSSLERALTAGQCVFGENTMQESIEKISHFAGRGVEWHFIGHLQSNKAKFLPGNFSWIHSLDSVNLAERLSRLASENKATVDALIEINITSDPRKHGVDPAKIFLTLDQLLNGKLAGIRLRGLMAVGPYPAGEQEIRSAFAALRRLREECMGRFALRDFTELSMGMSGDYVPAIKEGATLLRLGTAIFGERDYPK